MRTALPLMLGIAAIAAGCASRGDLATPLAPKDQWYLRVPGNCRLFVREFGSGNDTVVVLHGGPGAEHGYLVNAIRGLEQSHYFVLYDQRGSLRSPCADSTATMAAHVADLDLLRSELKQERLTILAHSAGTRLANHYAGAHPDRVGGLILTGPVAPDPITAADSARARAADSLQTAWTSRPEIAAMLRQRGLDRPDSLMSSRERTHAWRVRFGAVNLYHLDRWPLMPGGQVFYNPRAGRVTMASMRRPYNPVPWLQNLGCFVTVIGGTHDYVDIGAARHRVWVAQIPNARLIEIPNAGHSAWLDDPVGFRNAVATGLARAQACRESR